jgi:4-hydroxy-2-oxoheptanedioate aldolase
MSLRTRLETGETVVGSWVNLGSAVTAEIMGLAGFDWLLIDLEHGAGSEATLIGQLQALGQSGVTTLVRVESIESARVLHALDAGADGILAPRLRSDDDARRCVEYCRYRESRGVARQNRAWQWGLRAGTLSEADAAVFCAVQIETPEALAAVSEIAAVDGVDVLFVGPADLANGLGMDCAPDDPQLLSRVVAVAEAARKHGKAAGVYANNVEQARSYHELGFRFLGCGSEGGFLATVAQDAAAEMRALAGR